MSEEFRNGCPLKLTEVSMSQCERDLESAYIANHPYMSSGEFDHLWMSGEELILSLETTYDMNRQRIASGDKIQITPSRFAQQMDELVSRSRNNPR